MVNNFFQPSFKLFYEGMETAFHSCSGAGLGDIGTQFDLHR